MKYLFLFIFTLILMSCSSYEIKLGKRCIDNVQGGQDWSFIWLHQKGVKFNDCEVIKND